MFSKQSRLFRSYYFFSSIVVVAMLSYVTWEFWKKGMMNADSDAQVYEAIALTRDLKEAQALDQVKFDILRNNIANGALNLEKIEKNLSQIAGIKKSSVLDVELKNRKAALKESITKLTTYPSTTVLIQVLKEKVGKFQLFVNTNGWPTLAKITERIIQSSHNLSPINFDNNSRILRSIGSDILHIKETSENSALSLENKALVSLRLRSVEAELRMLNEFIDDQRTFLAAHENYKKVFETWINSVIPELALRKNSINTYAKDFLQYLLIVVVASLGLMCIGGLLSRYQIRREDKEGALTLKEIIEGQLIVNHYRGHPDFSPELDKVLASYHLYFQKRMNLGLLFQESLPVPALVIDSNYKVSWANKNFIEAWELDENDVREEKLSWDFIKRFTNLGNIDPVGSALKEKVAGIFEIELQTSAQGKVVPYEMFVTPVESSGGTKIMAYFYPMTKQVETINQLQSSIETPVQQTIDLLMAGGLTEDESDVIGAQFKAQKMDETWSKMKQMDSFIKNTRESLIMRIGELEKTVQDQTQEVQEATFHKLELLKYNKSLQFKMKSLKENVVKQSEEFAEFNERLDSLKIASSALATDTITMKNLNEELLQGLKEHTAPVMEMIRVKDDFKVLKDELAASRSKIMSYFDQVQMFERTQSLLDQERLATLMNRLKREIIELDKNMVIMDKRIGMLDVHLSKAEILTVDVVNKVKDKEPAISEQGQHMREKMTTVFDECRDLASEIGRLEMSMIRDFEEIYALLKKARSLDESRSTSEFSSSRPKELSTM